MGAFQSQHWYAPDGSPAYGATLRDARKDNLVPSVTTIERVIAAPQLVRWQVEQALDAALTLPRIDGESLDAFKERARADSERQAKEAAEKGSALHDALESYYRDGAVGNWEKWEPHIAAVDGALRAHFEVEGERLWTPEASFAHPLGFGGKCDLHAPGIVVDFKSKPRIEDGKKYAYDNHARQLAAYAVGLGMAFDVNGALMGDNMEAPPVLANLFIGIEDAKVSVHIWKPEQAAKGWRQFRAALALWQEMNNYRPDLREAA